MGDTIVQLLAPDFSVVITLPRVRLIGNCTTNFDIPF
jgi:hypothetical protein